MRRVSAGWWVYGVPPLAALHIVLFVTLQSRPGAVAPLLWNLGPSLLVIAAAVLLTAALMSSLRRRETWSWGRGAGLLALLLLVMATGVYRTYPSSHDDRPSTVDFRLPLDGPVTVVWGGGTPRVNYHVSSPSERWAYDLLVTIDGLTHSPGTKSLKDYYAYDRPVRAPADGRVIEVHDGDPDAQPGRGDRRRRGGNRIVLEVAPREYLFLLHLKAGTIRVTPGQAVRQGEVLANVGNSGNSTEPHVHVHLQDSPLVGRGEGIPLYFSNYVILAAGETVTRGIPRGGVRSGRFLGETIASRQVADPAAREHDARPQQ